MTTPAPAPPSPSGAHDSATTRALRLARRIAVGVVGGTILLLGIVLVVTPGPSTLVLALGLAILATEFLWARRFLKKIRKRIDRIRGIERDDDTRS